MSRTIAALATPPGTGGLHVIRISGEESFEIVNKCFSGNLLEAASHRIIYGKIVSSDKVIDTVTVSTFKAPRSYTGENVIEIGCHGGQIVSQEILKVLFENGAYPAEPGEFTKKAFLNGKLDLTQVEAVADLIHSTSIPGAQTAARQLSGNFTLRLAELRQKLLDTAALLELELDFSEEELEFVDKTEFKQRVNDAIDFCKELASSYSSAEILRSGFYVALAGYPNSGKSTLFNTLLSRQRAIVSPTPGTTRDYLEENIIIGGITVKLTDTAGLREDSKDLIEIEGIRLVESVLEQSNLILVLNDVSESVNHSDSLYQRLKEKYSDRKVLLLQNKVDLVNITHSNDEETYFISAKLNEGVDTLRRTIGDEAEKSADRITDILINKRHAELLTKAAESLQNALNALDIYTENEIIAIDIKEAAQILGDIVGDTWDEDVLNTIFSRFCIGK
jgi:tRNA modification GTPase